MHLGSLENYIWHLTFAATVALIARLYFQRLARIYRLLFLYLVMDALQSVLALVFAGNDRLYRATYVGGQTLKVTAAIFVTMELFHLALVQQPALARFGRSVIGYFLAAAATFAALNVLFGAPVPKRGHPLLSRFEAFERSTDLMVMVVLILMSVFLLWFPVRARRNAAVCVAGFVVYSFQRWTGLLLTALWPNYTRQFSIAMLGVSLACLTAWIVLLRRDGETTTVETGHRWNPTEAARLRFQLDAINATLGRSGTQ